MNILSVEFIIRMKEEKDSSLYDKFIEKVIQHVGAVDTSVWEVSIEDVIQTIKDQEKEPSGLFGTQQLEREDSVVSHQESMVEQEVHLEASESTQQSSVEPGFTVQLGRESSVTPPEVIGYSTAMAAATTVVPGRYPESLGGFHLNLTPKGLGMTLKEIKAKELLCDPSSYPKGLERVYDKLNDYCKLRCKRKGLTKADNWDIISERK